MVKLARREPPGRGENSIIPCSAYFVKRNLRKNCTKLYPKISAKLPVDFFKNFRYNIFTR